ncbi:aldo/keto reductase [Lacihabitans sp. LS3-19]|uniref:aldo/keto reductase n=1 Tax=Lacihabitans sp. LS3-19 TaxID=2487335 RepID=UPI0020CD4A47|nr:aldo/keto reductase [Lacihabitans sp. LS3-19]MCP9769452.1 aldo/keto reductase [Lacihabitans sp. LS3-19]
MKFLRYTNGDQMPILGLGTWKSAPGEVYEAVRTAIKIGYRHFDCAHLYGNEPEIGDALADAMKDGEVKREDLWITSKLWNNRHRLEQVEPAIKLTLKNLRLDYLDLYLIHWPIALKDDVNFPTNADEMVSLSQTPLSETWQGMINVKAQGLTKHIGTSNFSIKKIKDITAKTGEKPEMNQVEMHPFLQQNTLKEFCDVEGIFMTGYSPLGSADRPANRIVEGEPKLFENEILKTLAERKKCSTAQIMLAWAVNRGTSVIPKSVRAERLKENLEAADIELSVTERSLLASVNLDYRYIKGDFWCLPGTDYTIENLWDEGA